MDPGHAPTIHRTRIAFKRFRYMAEALQPLFREISPRRLAAMHAYQSTMGELQDTEVFLARLHKFTRKRRAHARALAGLRTWLLQCRTAQIDQCLRQADLLSNFWPLRRSEAAPLPQPRLRNR
jgi:CHAD domain-containing protein